VTPWRKQGVSSTSWKRSVLVSPSCPQRGHIPPELARIAVTTYREVHFKPYRVIYEVVGDEVFVHCVIDGRRDMQLLLERRLVR